ncbi:Metallo-hydrolase/oxidoreductase, partial [Rhodotorula sp. JG-1b]
DAPVAPFEHYYGFPKGTGTCSSVKAFSPSSLVLHEYQMVHPGGDPTERLPVCAFLIKHATSGDYALFDLGLWKDWSETIAPEKREAYEVYQVNVEEDLDSVLEKQGVKAEDIKVIVISHHHFDHCGTTRLLTFPNARVIVGPETRNKIYAVETHGNVTELSWHHSPTQVATFEHSYDVWGDGSFLVVATPGHTAGHVAGLVRTADSPAEYVLLGGDCCHSGLLLHPTPEHAHLRLGRWREPGEPLAEPPKHSMHEDLLQAEFSFERVKAAEKRDEIMVVLAHDKRRWELWGGPKATTTGIELAGWRKKGMK